MNSNNNENIDIINLTNTCKYSINKGTIYYCKEYNAPCKKIQDAGKCFRLIEDFMKRSMNPNANSGTT